MPRRAPGRIQRKLIELIEGNGFTVTLMLPTRGYWLHAHQDCVRWECQALRETGQTQVDQIQSWYTMTECVKAGITIERDPTSYGFWNVKLKA